MKKDLMKFSSPEHPCYVICPFCNTQMDYGKISAKIRGRGEKDEEPCLNCGKFLDLISIGDGLQVIS